MMLARSVEIDFAGVYIDVTPCMVVITIKDGATGTSGRTGSSTSLVRKICQCKHIYEWCLALRSWSSGGVRCHRVRIIVILAKRRLLTRS